MKVVRITVAFALALMFAVGAAGCKDKDVAARVNGDVIKKSELDAQMAKLEETYPDMFEGADGEAQYLDFEQRILDNLINSLLIQQAAEERGIDVSDDEIDKKIEDLKASFQSEEQFQTQLEQAGMSLDDLKGQIRDQLVREQLIISLVEDKEVTDAEIAEYYKQNEARFNQEAAVHAAHILFDADDETTAEKVAGEIRGGGDFAALAKQYSTDAATAEKGGDLGWPQTPFVPEFQEAADALDVGEVSDPVRTQFGWHIIKVIEKREAGTKTLDESSEQIEQLIIQQRNADAYQAFLNELREKAEIEILVPELRESQPAATKDAGEADDSK